MFDSIHLHLGKEAWFMCHIALLIGAPYLLWRKVPGLKRFAPLVVVQIAMGILLGPSVLGKFFPSIFSQVGFFGSTALGLMNGLAMMALVLFGFATGLHFDHRELQGKGKAFIATALAATLVPFLLCFLAGYFWIFDAFGSRLVGEAATKLTFSLGLGIAGGVTALPVLGKILKETGLIYELDGKIALGLATVSDGLLWLAVAVLNVLVASGNSKNSSHESGNAQVVFTIAAFSAYLGLMWFFVRPQLDRLNVKHRLNTAELAALKKWDSLDSKVRPAPVKLVNGEWKSTLEHFKSLNWLQRELIVSNDLEAVDIIKIMVLIGVAGLGTEVIGMHYLLGCFILGACMPKNEVLKLSTEGSHGHNQAGTSFALAKVEAFGTKSNPNPALETGHDPFQNDLDHVEVTILEHSANDAKDAVSHRRMYFKPSNASFNHELEAKIMPLLEVCLLPFFFMKTGLSTQFELNDSSIWIIFGIVTVLSSVGKIFGTYFPVRGIPGYEKPSEALHMGALMMCKGLMEVVVLMILRDAKIINNAAFSGLLIMAVFTTALTMPLMSLFKKRHQHEGTNSLRPSCLDELNDKDSDPNHLVLAASHADGE